MYNHILVPVSFDEERDSTPAIGLANALLAPGGKVTFLHVIEEVPAYAVSYLTDEYLNEVRQSLLAGLDEMAGKVMNGEGEIVTGHSGRTILEYAENRDVDLIIIASHRPGVQDYFLGSTAARVVRHANCAVHVMR